MKRNRERKKKISVQGSVGGKLSHVSFDDRTKSDPRGRTHPTIVDGFKAQSSGGDKTEEKSRVKSKSERKRYG